MALFNTRKSENKEKKNSPKKEKEERALKPGSLRIDQGGEGGEKNTAFIIRPRITEKASLIASDGGYTFNVDARANKIQIKHAIKEIYNVFPKKIRIVAIPKKKVLVRNRIGVKGGGKKAIVYLKEGDKIEFV